MGSLDKDIETRFGRNALGLVESAKKHVKILEDLDFHNIVLSLKASDVKMSIEEINDYKKSFAYLCFFCGKVTKFHLLPLV